MSNKEELPVIDWSLWDHRCHHHADLIEEAIKTLAHDLPLFEKQMHEAVAANDIEALRGTIHTCLGMLRFCALPRLEKTVENLHEIVHHRQAEIPAALKDYGIQSHMALEAIKVPRT